MFAFIKNTVESKKAQKKNCEKLLIKFFTVLL